ncbi:hypothetical protein, partial [Pseudolysinimonas sp.]|uniref:hypothetical protein n=1 Tax=Pseudolysinimonas sp. TaxID=2680009 RepID=UPI0037841513
MSATPGPDPRRARVRRVAGVALTLVLGGLGIAVFVTAVTPHGSSTVIAPDDPAEVSSAPIASEI